MSGIISISWLTPDPVQILTEPWLLSSAMALPSPLMPRLTTWDSATDLELSRTIIVHADQVRRDCAISGELRLVATWWCPATGIGRLLSAKQILSDSARIEITLNGVVRGADVSEKMTLRTLLVLPSGTRAEQPLSPRRPGSILWEDAVDLVLEGSASRFPTESVDFSSLGWPSTSGWFLHWDDTELESPFQRAVRLYINSAHKSVCAAAAGPSSNAENRAIMSAIRFDVARSLLCHGLNDEAFVEDPSRWPSESVGDAIFRMLRLYFPHETPRSVAQMLKNQPERFSLYLQSTLAVFEDVKQ